MKSQTSGTSGSVQPICYGQVISSNPSLVTLHYPTAMQPRPPLINVWICAMCGLEITVRSVSEKREKDENGKNVVR